MICTISIGSANQHFVTCKGSELKIENKFRAVMPFYKRQARDVGIKRGASGLFEWCREIRRLPTATDQAIMSATSQ